MTERQESLHPGPVTGGDKRVFLMVVLALAGVWICLTLTDFHFGGGKGGIFRSVCEVSGEGCDQVLQSQWSMLPRNIPLAWAGLVYFSVLALWYLTIGRANRAGRVWFLPVFALQLLGAVGSLFLLGVMLVQMRTLCGWCALTHIINLVLLVLAWRIWPREPTASGEPSWPPRRLGIAAVLLAVLAILYWNQWLINRYLGAQVASFRGDTDLMRYVHLRHPQKEIPVRADEPVRGNAAARHTIVVFSDFQCPSCRNFSAFFEKEIRPLYGDRVRLIFRHAPLDNDCNSHLPRTIHPQACEAAHAAEAARELGGAEGFWKMHDVLFERAPTLPQARWAEMAASAGLDGVAVADRVAKRVHASRIKEDVELGFALDLHGTPAVYIDGRPLADWTSLVLWKAILGPAEKPQTTASAP